MIYSTWLQCESIWSSHWHNTHCWHYGRKCVFKHNTADVWAWLLLVEQCFCLEKSGIRSTEPINPRPSPDFQDIFSTMHFVWTNNFVKALACHYCISALVTCTVNMLFFSRELFFSGREGFDFPAGCYFCAWLLSSMGSCVHHCRQTPTICFKVSTLFTGHGASTPAMHILKCWF